VALIDIRLDRSNGIALIAKLKKACPGILCVMMAAYAAIDTAVKALKEGANDYLRKPIDINDFLATLDRCFEKRRLEDGTIAAEERLILRNVAGLGFFVWHADCY
jgi:DNA-binding NtrC family response regulator